MAFQMLAIILLFTFGGIKLDKCLALSFPIFTVVLSLTGVILGICVGIKDFFKKSRKVNIFAKEFCTFCKNQKIMLK